MSTQRPIKQSFFGSLRRDAHWKCLILTLLIIGCLSAIAWCRLAVLKKTPPPSASSSYILSSHYSFSLSNRQDMDGFRESPCDDGYVYIPVAFVIMLYLVYIVECWHSHTRIELQYKVDINTVYDKVRDMREGVPVIWWKAICYHYVRRTRQVTRYRNGDAFTSTQVYYERVNTCTAGSAFNFTQCGVKDISRSLHGLETYPATKIRFSKGFSFASVESECEFEDQRAQFFQDYENRDDYMEGREGMDILNVNFKEYMIAFADPDNLPWYVSHVIFWAASFLLLSWPLRVIIEYKTAHLHYHVHKLFGTNYVDMEAFRGSLSRASTMNSAEMEMNIRNNNFMVPSYSDALLINATRRASILSVLTTGGIPRFFLGNTNTTATATRSVTNPNLHPSPSTTTFTPGSLPSFPMTSVRRFQSCTAIQQGDKPPVSRSRSSILANLLGLRNLASSTTSCGNEFVSEENAANQGMDRRRWRRKRNPGGSIPFSGSFFNALLATTPEEMPMITMETFHGEEASASAAAAAVGSSGDGGDPALRREGEGGVNVTAVVVMGPSREDRDVTRTDIPYIDSPSGSEAFCGTDLSSTPATEAGSPPGYTEALVMPKLSNGGNGQGSSSSRPPRGDHDTQRRVSSSGDLSLSRFHQNKSGGTRPRLQHSESVRLMSRTGGGQTRRFYRSTSQGLALSPPQSSNTLLSNGSASRLTRSEGQGFEGPPVTPGISPVAAAAADRPRPSPHVHSSRIKMASLDDPDQPPARATRFQRGWVEVPSLEAASASSTCALLLQHQPRGKNDQTPNSPILQQSVQSKSSQKETSPPRTELVAELPAAVLPMTSADARLEVSESNTGGKGRSSDASPAAVLPMSSAYARLEVDESRSGDCSNSRATLERSLIPLRLPTVITPRSAMSDDEDMTPVRESGSWLSLTGSCNSLTTTGRPADGATARGESSTPMLSSPQPPESSHERGGEAGGGGEGEGVGGGGEEGEGSDQSLSSSSRLISPSTAQRCYRSVHCMETAL
ncbi:hypothetical protein ACOMHN_040861 [Nucella lapillus]